MNGIMLRWASDQLEMMGRVHSRYFFTWFWIFEDELFWLSFILISTNFLHVGVLVVV